MHRLHPCGAANRGVCVDALGAMLGPECVLVERTPKGFGVVPRGVARHAQHLLFKRGDNPDWLYEQSRRGLMNAVSLCSSAPIEVPK
jgi:hypothetical protein